MVAFRPVAPSISGGLIVVRRYIFYSCVHNQHMVADALPYSGNYCRKKGCRCICQPRLRRMNANQPQNPVKKTFTVKNPYEKLTYNHTGYDNRHKINRSEKTFSFYPF